MSDHESVKRFPLEWPVGWTRTGPYKRIRPEFQQTKHDLISTAEGTKRVSKQMAVTVYVATTRLERQLELLGAAGPTLSTNLSLRLDGRPRSEQEPSDPGAAVYFRFKGKATVLACDRYITVAGNIAAIAAHIDALRRIERYGVGTIEQALAGYKALPADSAANWRAVFGFSSDSRPTLESVDRVFKEMARDKHPDRGGTEAGMAHLNRARDYARTELTT